LRRIGVVLACQFGVGQTASNDLSYGDIEPLCVVVVLAMIEPERLLVCVRLQVERLDTDVGPLIARFIRLQKFSIPLV